MQVVCLHRWGMLAAQCHLVSGCARKRKQNNRVMFVHDIRRSVSTISVVSESRTGWVFTRAVSEAWIWFAARYLQRQCGGMAHDLAAPAREPEFDRSRAVSAAERSSGSAQRLPTMGSG